MKVKVIVSAGIVVGFAAVSIIASAWIPCSALGNVEHREKETPVTKMEAPVPVRSAMARVYPEEVSDGQAEDTDRWSREDTYLLAKIAMAEAEGEDTEGKALVMLVVLNRIRSDKFPNAIEEVIYQKGQFSPIEDGRFDMVEPDVNCWEALKLIKSGWDGSMGATYFESESESTWHKDNLQFLFRHGAHSFYTD